MPTHSASVRRLPALMAARAALATGDHRLRGLFERLEVATLAEAEWRLLDPQGMSLTDVDRPQDLPQEI